MIRITELKLPLSAIPVAARRAADAPTETDADRAPIPHPLQALTQLAAQALGIATSDIASLEVFKRSFDARKAELLVVYIVDLTLADPQQTAALLQRFDQHPHIGPTPDMVYRLPTQAPADFGQREGERPVVVGFGPCGMFAALLLAQMGLRPIVLERGPSVRQRTQDTWGLWRKKVLKPGSNVQFGEGGAGTFSDGKLYSQIKDPRFLGRKVMQEFVKAGAPSDILFEAHPHIGTFKLVKVVESMREQIIALGGEVRFEQRVVDLLLKTELSPHVLQGLEVENTLNGSRTTLRARHVVLALGHSARDTFAMLYQRGVAMQAKPFSVGFRIEHPQSVIDRARWGRHAGNPLLGAADYKLVHHAKNGRSVYSFCMCPGGTVVAATSEPGRVVTNGMSQYSRNERNANAGLVVGIEPADFPCDEATFVQAFGAEDGKRFAAEAAALAANTAPATAPHSTPRTAGQATANPTTTAMPHAAECAATIPPCTVHPLAGIALQRQLESRAYLLGGSSYEAPGQLVGDFLAARPSTLLGSVQPSYQPGVKLGDLASSLPDYAIAALREALPVFGRKIKGFDMADAVLTGVETRTSSPLKIPRGENLQSVSVSGLYPAGEGASYAGGILSAAVDGIKVAEAVARSLLNT